MWQLPWLLHHHPCKQQQQRQLRWRSIQGLQQQQDLITYLAGEHREGDMFGFLLDLQQLRGMSAVQRLEYAAGKGYLPLLRAVHKMLDKPLWAKEGLICAAHTGESASTLGIVSRNASIHGQLHVLQYLQDVGCPLDAIICNWAAEGGHLDSLKYAHKHGCLWDADTCCPCTMRMSMGVSGKVTHFTVQQVMVTYFACSMRMRKGVSGMLVLVLMQPEVVDWIVCSMRLRMGVRGMPSHVLMQSRVVTLIACGMLMSRGVHGIYPGLLR
jgi:hypothetical protein